MCGLAFLYHDNLNPPDLTARIRHGLTRLRHRGPDEHGIVDGACWCAGHQRLSIVDLAESHQPMTDASQRYWLVYNGEIYNYRQLRSELAALWPFATNGDTEVVLAGLVSHGEAFLARMEGMWALALWDAQERLLLLSRDRMGKKPLYYEEGTQRFSCASELPALACLSDRDWLEDPDSTADYLRYGFYLPGTTAYRDVHEVLPGHTLHWQLGGKSRQKPYWQLRVAAFSRTRHDAVSELRNAIDQAVERRLVADVEVGAFLSGGVDSSLVAALAQRKLPRALRTFTMGFSDASFDERKYAALVAQHIGSLHTVDVFPPETPNALETLIFDHVGQPFADVSLLPTAGISDLASRHVKVVLSGDGGDELFSGYQRYQARQILRWYTRLPHRLREVAAKAIRALPEPMTHHSGSILKKAQMFTHIAERLPSETPYVCARMFSDPELENLAPSLADRGHAPPGLLSEATLDDLPRMMFADALVYLPQDILLKVDRASMAHGLEARAPLLDREVVELAFSLPMIWHRNFRGGKRMLQAAFSDLLPQQIWQRRKQGFGVPVHAWIQGEIGDRLLVLVQNGDGQINPDYVTQLLNEHRTGKRDHGLRLWSVYIHQLWRHRLP